MKYKENSMQSDLTAPVRPRRRRTGVRHVEKPVAQLDDDGVVVSVMCQTH